MGVVRGGVLALVAGLAGCRFTPPHGPSDPAEAALVDAGAPAAAPQFASLPRRPGERVPLAPPVSPAGASGVTRATQAPTVDQTQPLRPVEVPAGSPPGPLLIAPPPDPPLVAAARDYLANRPEAAAEKLRVLDKPNGELTAKLLPAAVQASTLNLARPNAVEVQKLVRAIEEAQALLAPSTPLTIDKSVLIHGVTGAGGFGDYEPHRNGCRYAPGDMAEVYLELSHVQSVKVPAKEGGTEFQTSLVYHITVTDAAGNPAEGPSAAEGPLPAIRFTRSRVRDYHDIRKFRVPSKPGEYRVRCEVRDGSRPGERQFVSASLKFWVVAR